MVEFQTPAPLSAASPLPMSLYAKVRASAIALQWIVLPSEHTNSSSKIPAPEQSCLAEGRIPSPLFHRLHPTQIKTLFFKKNRRLKIAWKWTSILISLLPSMAGSKMGFRVLDGFQFLSPPSITNDLTVLSKNGGVLLVLLCRRKFSSSGEIVKCRDYLHPNHLPVSS